MTHNPILITLFGATGDLAARKLYPAIYNLYRNGQLSEQFALIGTARRPWSAEHFREVVANSVQHLAESPEHVAQFASHFYYQSHDVNNTDHYIKLKELADQLDTKYQLAGNRIFYLSMSPTFFPIIAENIKAQHLFGSGFNRLIIEKPFGHDLESARELQDKLNVTFEEEQIFRIDHYLGKEMVQAIQHLRFDNPLFAQCWNHTAIANVQISLPELVGVEERAGYYDTSGATRDMVQNHILQLLTVLTMPLTHSDAPDAVQQAKYHVLSSIQLYQSLEEVAQSVVRAQYAANPELNLKGYLEEDNVNPASLTETYFAAKLQLNLPEWQGVPFYIRTGKRVNKKATLIDIIFKASSPEVAPNHLRIEIAPELGYTLWLNTKEIGYEHASQSIPLSYYYTKEALAHSPEDYERLIFECIKGNRRHFAQWCEVEYAWRYIDTIHHYWQQSGDTTLPQYLAGTTGPIEADELLARDGFTWVD